MRRRWPPKFKRLVPAHVIAALIFVTTLLIYWYSPVSQATDSKYSMLVSQSLLKYRSFALDHYAIARLEPVQREYVMDGDIYQLELVSNHVYYFLPPGSSVLSVPYVALMNAFGISAANPDGTYNHLGETEIETSLAALLMAVLATIFFYTSRLVLPTHWSVLVALGGGLGTQVWSTSSRAMWSHTWDIFLLGIVVYMLLAYETSKRRMKPVLLASLLAWMYFVRPSCSVTIVALSIYVFLYHRRLFVSYAMTGALWLAGFLLYSWHNFGQLLPNYYRASRLNFETFGIALLGNLISPARGVLVYVPVLFFVAYLLMRHRRYVPFQRLLWLALAIIAGHLFVASAFRHWWGGHCYGPRFTTDLVPCFVLLAILGLKALLVWREQQPVSFSLFRWRAQLALGGLLLAMSVLINARGATSIATWWWNTRPADVDQQPERLWDWRQPQFLAGLVRPPPPDRFPLLEGRLNFATAQSQKYLWYGWGWSENSFRWSDGKEAAVVFGLVNKEDYKLIIRFAPFLSRGKLDEQRVDIFFNGELVQTLRLSAELAEEYSFRLSKEQIRDNNVLTFKLPNAMSPKSLGLSSDQRELGIRVDWIYLQPAVE